MNNTELTEADYTKLLDYREAAAALVLLAQVGEKLHQNGPWSSNSKLPLLHPHARIWYLYNKATHE